MDKIYVSEDGLDRTISMLAVDAGYATQEVYAWVRSQSSTRVIAIKGSDKALVPLSGPSRVDITLGGRKLRRGAKLWTVGVSILKAELYHGLKLTRVDNGFPAGYCHFPSYESGYFKQLTAEQLVTKIIKGYPKREWQKIRDRNEALDCRIYARAAAIALGIDRWSKTRWESLYGKMKSKTQDSFNKLSYGLSPKPIVRPRVIRSQWIV